MITPRSRSPRALAWTEWGSAILAATVLMQAALAGQFTTSRPGLLETHRLLAEVVPIGAIALVVVASRLRGTVQGGRRLLGLAVSALVVTVVQTGLGFAGRTSPSAVAVHIPLGVAMFGLFLWITSLAHSERQSAKVGGRTTTPEHRPRA